jgi:hypothetical protein
MCFPCLQVESGKTCIYYFSRKFYVGGIHMESGQPLPVLFLFGIENPIDGVPMCNMEIKVAVLRSEKKGYEIARQLDWHPSKLSQIISGVYLPDSNEKQRLAKTLGQSVNKLSTKQSLESVHA